MKAIKGYKRSHVSPDGSDFRDIILMARLARLRLQVAWGNPGHDFWMS